MIQSMAAAPGAANAGVGAPAVRASSQVTGGLPANPLDVALQAFGQRMAQLGDNDDVLAVETEQALPEQVLPWQGDPAEPSEVPAQAAQSELPPEESAAEQWLLGMLGQQQLIVGARDSAILGTATPRLPEGAPASLHAMAAAAEGLAQREQGAARAASADPALPPGGEVTLPRAMLVAGEPSRAAHANDPVAGQPPLAAAPAAAEPRGSVPAELLAAATATDGIEPSMAVERAQLPQPSATEGLLRLQAPQARWGEQMLHALREHVDLQVQQKVQSATIRLDPPELGAMEILLSHESGRLTVQLTAAHADVARLLQQTSDRLRQELVSQHFVQVSVQVGADGQQGQHGQPRQGAPRANHEPVIAGQLPSDPHDDQVARGPRDVLVTV